MKRVIMFAIVLMAILPIAIIGSAVTFSAQTAIKNEKQEALAATVHIMSIHLDSYYNHLVSDIQMKAERSALRSLMDTGRAEGWKTDSAVVSTEVREIVLESIGFPVVGGAVIDQEGKVILSTQREEEGLMFNRTELYQSIMNGAESNVGWVEGDDTTSHTEIAVPIRDEHNQVIGILRQDVDVELIRDYLNSVSGGNGRYSFLIRKNGSFFYNRIGDYPTSLFTEYQNSNSLENLVTDFKTDQLKSEKGIIEFENKGIEYLGAYEKVEPIDCVAVVAIDKADIFDYLKMIRSILMAAFVLLVLLIASCGYMIAYLHLKPLKMMNDTLRRITNGDLAARCQYNGRFEFLELSNNINNLAESFQKNEKELRLSSRMDGLTRLPNRNAIYELMDTLFNKHPNQALLLLDLEGFKGINDNLGYDTGDRILVEVGDILRKLPQHVCYPSRLGGAEFLVFVTNWTVPRYPETIAEKIIREIQEIHFIDEVHVDINVNIGIVHTDIERVEKRKLIKYAKIAMQKARISGKNSYDIY